MNSFANDGSFLEQFQNMALQSEADSMQSLGLPARFGGAHDPPSTDTPADQPAPCKQPGKGKARASKGARTGSKGKGGKGGGGKSRSARAGGKGAAKGRSKPEYDPSTPCGYYMAGHCRFGVRCSKQHSTPYAMAVRAQWLNPSDTAAIEALQQQAAETLGGETGDSLFPRVLSRPLSMQPPQQSGAVRYLLILDLEGKDEITEFPVIVFDVEVGKEIGRFQRYVRPVKLFDGCELVVESPAVEFDQVLTEFDQWLHGITGHTLAQVGSDVAFLTCGDWDCKHVKTQCKISRIPLPAGFLRWINIKKSFSAHHGCEIRGMRSMLGRLGLLDNRGNTKGGFHHLGMHDVENIGRCVVHLLKRGFEFEVNGSQKAAK